MISEASGNSRLSATLLIALCGLTLILGVVHGAYIPFWGDELATLHIAEVPTWAEMFRLSRTVDLNPPLEATLVWLSVHAFGSNGFAGRLPSVVGYTVAVGCLFLYLRRRMPLWFATAGALLLLCNASVAYYATEARPYALLMATIGLALVLYDLIVVHKGKLYLARIGLFLAVIGILISHVFGLFAMGAFLLAEIVRTIRRGHLDVLTWFALLLPMASCILYAPLLHGQHGLSYPAEYRPTIFKGVSVYKSFILEPLIRFLAVAFGALIFFKKYPERGFLKSLRLSAESWAVLLTLLATPIILATLLYLRSPSGSFFPRYAVAVFYPAIFFLIGFLAWRSRNNKSFGKLLAGVALLATLSINREVPGEAKQLLYRGLFAAPDQVRSTGGVNAIEPSLPLVSNNALAFMQEDNRLRPQDTARLVYVTDDAEAMRIVHSDAGESVADMAAAFHLHAQVVPYATFIASYEKFLVLGEPDHVGDWFLQSVIQGGASVCFLGKYNVAGKSLPLWLVSLHPATQP